ncbi:MAG: Holliday junction resolvase RuvX [Bacteroidales bacterium]|nr:Holliday junction resolvase RuvX [Bacteroidales bacterium]
MDRLIGIDYGRKRTGLAASDPLRIFASALETVDSAKLIDYLKNYAQKETIERFVVGYPVNLDGSPSEARTDVDAFLNVLRKAFPETPVTLEDERFTSVLAHQAMIDGGMKAKDRRDKRSVDRISAAIILQGYMDRTSGATFAVNPDSVPESLSRKNTRRKKNNR